ncbi:MAG: hypothetical protein HY910_06450 [Desulfarculus sp.]|nr:hypothetical protein [Desulfarculus sp.]
MDEMTLDLIWETMEQALALLESGQGDQARLSLTLQECLCLLLDFPAAELVARAERSPLPTRSIISWLVFEAGRLSQSGQGWARALRDCWEGSHTLRQSLIRPTPCQPVG